MSPETVPQSSGLTVELRISASVDLVLSANDGGVIAVRDEGGRLVVRLTPELVDALGAFLLRTRGLWARRGHAPKSSAI